MFRVGFRVEIKGLENYQKAGNRVLILANHQSFLDPLMLYCLLPDKPAFAINPVIANLWWIKPWLRFARVFRIDPTNPMSTKSLIEYMEQNKKIVLFPEGRITVTGSIMKVYEGPGLVAEKTGAKILPIQIEGAQYSTMSRLGGKVRRRLFPKIRMTILPPVEIAPVAKGKDRRTEIANRLQWLLSESQFAAANYNRPILSAVIEAAETHGSKRKIVEDINRVQLSYRQLFLKTIGLSAALAPELKEQNIGVLLPNTIANVVTVFSLHNLGKTPAMLNFTAGGQNINNACVTADIETILTSKAFIEKGGLEDLLAAISSGKKVIFLEDMKDKVPLSAKLKALALCRFPRIGLKNALKAKPSDTAFILFTSGSEGVPKGVVLSHSNIVANVEQARSVIELNPRDVALNALPMFHSFGLTVGTILPLITGFKAFLYPTPLHFNIIPEISYAIQATILMGTDTFLGRYGKAAHTYDFFSVRYVIAGAEKLKPATRQLWSEKFGIRILEGYGVTETSPFMSVNTPILNKTGTVGRIVPGMEYELRQVEGINEGGELWVKGPNVMQGYYKLDKPCTLQPPENGWYGTGDIVSEDSEHFISIVGRAKRFAKIAGEMVSLPMVEETAGKLWPGEPLAVIAVKDEAKGENLVMVAPNKKLSLDEFKEFAAKSGLPGIAIPRKVVNAEIPLLGSGKTDYPALQKLVESEA